MQRETDGQTSSCVNRSTGDKIRTCKGFTRGLFLNPAASKAAAFTDFATPAWWIHAGKGSEATTSRVAPPTPSVLPSALRTLPALSVNCLSRRVNRGV